MFSIVHYKNLSWNQQWIGPSGRILGPQHMVKGSIFASCIWEKKNCWKSRTRLACLINSLTKISHYQTVVKTSKQYHGNPKKKRHLLQKFKFFNK